LTIENAAKLRSTYSGRRSLYLQELHLKTSVFSRDEDAEEECRDTEEELKDMDEDFTSQIKFLFSTLDNFEKDLADKFRLGPMHLTIYEATRANDEDYMCCHHMFVSWRTHLFSPSSLPKLDSVQSLTIKTPQLDINADGPGRALRRLDFRTILDLAKRCPNLKLLHCKLGGSELQNKFQHEELQPVVRQFEGPRRDSRRRLAEDLKGLNDAVTFLRDVHLIFLFSLGEVELLDQFHCLFQSIGRKDHGDELLECWEDDRYERGLS
jgi:hypothetical protein